MAVGREKAKPPSRPRSLVASVNRWRLYGRQPTLPLGILNVLAVRYPAGAEMRPEAAGHKREERVPMNAAEARLAAAP
jgi:hypothetical protein